MQKLSTTSYLNYANDCASSHRDVIGFSFLSPFLEIILNGFGINANCVHQNYHTLAANECTLHTAAPNLKHYWLSLS